MDRWILRFCWVDMGAAAARGDEIDDGLGVVTTVGDERSGWRQSVDQRLDGRLVRRLPRRQHDPKRQAVLIDQGMILVLSPPRERPMA